MDESQTYTHCARSRTPPPIALCPRLWTAFVGAFAAFRRMPQFMGSEEAPPPCLRGLRFSHTFATLPCDGVRANYSRTVPKGCLFSHVDPTPLKDPRCVVWDAGAAELLDLHADDADVRAMLPYLAGNRLLDGTTPLAQAYGGRQFGVWVAQLGDGRAVQLGEVMNAAGLPHPLPFALCPCRRPCYFFAPSSAIAFAFACASVLALATITRTLSLCNSGRVPAVSPGTPGSIPGEGGRVL